MSITRQDLRALREYGRAAVTGQNDAVRSNAAREAGFYLALAANKAERALIRSEFEEGARNAGADQYRVNGAMFHFFDWEKFWIANP